MSDFQLPRKETDVSRGLNRLFETSSQTLRRNQGKRTHSKGGKRPQLQINGLRQGRKVRAKGPFLDGRTAQSDICILVATHLMGEKTESIVIDTRRWAHSSLSKPNVAKACGGVLIFVKIGLRFSMPNAALFCITSPLQLRDLAFFAGWKFACGKH